MIAIVDVSIQAANPSMPLYPWQAYLNSPSSLRIRNVPRRIGNWNIDKVYVTAAYPDNAIKSAQCVLVGGIWVCTIEGSTISGLSQNGYTIYADGKDENGNEVTGYVLGKGDITILESDGTITPDETSYYVHMLSAEPTSPKEGDLWQTEGSWFIYQDGTSYPIGDDSGLIRQLSNELSNYANVSALNNYFPLSGGTLSSSEGEIDIGPWGAMFHNDTVLTSTNSNTINIRLKAKIEFDNLIDDTTDQTLYTQLSLKQDTLSDSQISAINSVVDERATYVKYQDGTISSFNIVGELSSSSIPNKENAVEVKIGNAVSSIGGYGLSWCSKLTNVTIPDSVTSINVQAFGYCTNLMSVMIPSSVISIGSDIFNGCTNLTSVTIIDNGLHNLKTIGDYAFQGCSSLLEITLPQGITTIGVDAFDETPTNFKLYLEEAIPSFVPSAANYPWGVSNTANIITIRNATKEWVEEQGYGKGFQWRNAPINVRNTCGINSFYINSATLTTARASFKVTMNATAYTIAREGYFILTLGNFTQPMTWDTPFDVFEGGSAEAIAPKPNTTNIYHIFEYASGHFMVSKFSSAFDELGDIETIVNAI